MSNIFKDEFKWLMDFCGIKRWIKKPFLPLDVIWAVENEMPEDNNWNMVKEIADVEIMA
jgi:hypothetical protein